MAAGAAGAADPPGPPGAAPETASAEAAFRQQRDAYVVRFRPLWMESETAWWEASVTGSDAAFARKKAADKALIELHSDRDAFARLRALRDGGQVQDPELRRELSVMYRAYLPGQADPELQRRIVELESDVEQIFNTHRSEVGGQRLSENDVRAILGTTRDSAAARAAWEGYMAVGGKVDRKLRELVGLRNEMARQLGFANYFALRLVLQEIDEAELLRLFDELDQLSAAPFEALKQSIDARRAEHYGLAPSALRPWHYADLFFQEAPPVSDVDFDPLLAGLDLQAVCARYYAGLGLPCDDILARSDLFERPGKSPHAFCTDLTRTGEDIRVLANLKPNLYWTDTLLHELGHGVYDKYIAADVPFLLHTASSGITTEGIALLFGSMSKNGDWLARLPGVAPEGAERVGAAAQATLRAEKLIFSRWAQVMVRFERGMYSQPDQNLGRLWWDLKKRYQLLHPPENVDRPDYAAKIHVVTTPVYYHSYMLGELFASQVRHRMAQALQQPASSSFSGQPQAGAFLKEQVFGPGNRYSWNELTQRATGEPLTARYFAEGL